ncbi:MAG: SpaH/EbpB family LPXTG-anchored major pilin [Actinomycetaceae bacterium]|nr:SpaH/EbpB family LPXTG-anchored major pilin [Actinomycetaceae bacterium]
MTQTHRLRVIIGVIAAFAVALMGMVFIPSADASVSARSPRPDDNIIFEDTNGSITVHKHETPEASTSNDGTELMDAPPRPVEGINFKLSKVDLDLTKSENWQKLDSLTYKNGNVFFLDAPTNYLAITQVGDEKTTDNNGKATFTDLGVAVYLVEETGGTPTTAQGSGHVVAKSEPFFVVLPMKDNKNQWNYNIHAYPKNSIAQVKKTIDDSKAFSTANKVTWTVEAQMPTGLDLQPNTKIVDVFDKRINTGSIGVTKVMAGTVPLKEGDDYTVTYDTTAEGRKVTVSFNSDALNKIKGQKVVVTYEGTVDPVTGVSLGEDGVIPNQATVTINGTDMVTNTVNTTWGDYEIFKYTTVDGAEKPLSEAKFTIYQPTGDPASCDTLGDEVLTTDATDTNGKTKFRVKAGTYCMKETTTPPGFTENTAVVKIEVAGGSSSASAPEKNYSKVENTKTNFPNLPLTGANGRLLLLIIGSALIALAVGTAIVQRRRKRATRNQ